MKKNLTKNMNIATLRYLVDNIIQITQFVNKSCNQNENVQYNYPKRFLQKKKRKTTNRNTIRLCNSSKHNYDIYSEIKSIKNLQKKTTQKLDKIICAQLHHQHGKEDEINQGSPNKLPSNFEVNKFNFDIIQKGDPFDYFSFKIKPDLLSSQNLKKASSPDKFINHKFFEDTDTFRNYTHLITEKTIELTKDNMQNPFALSGKTIKSNTSSIISGSNIRSHSNPHRKTMNPAEIFKETSEAIDNSENEKTNELKLMTNTIECCGNSEIAESESQSSSKILCNSSISQDGYKKVRGFNFKNNINTKKFNKPLLRNKTTDEEIHEVLEIEKVINEVIILEESNSSSNKNGTPKKVKKFNFNNNINIKKFIRKGSNTMVEDSSLTINDLHHHK
jgi:hypothetical protein